MAYHGSPTAAAGRWLAAYMPIALPLAGRDTSGDGSAPHTYCCCCEHRGREKGGGARRERLSYELEVALAGADDDPAPQGLSTY